MSGYIATVDSASTGSILFFFVKKDVSKGLAGFLSIRFLSRFAANVSMLYSPDSAASPGRSYLENFSLLALFTILSRIATTSWRLSRKRVSISFRCDD